MDKLITTIIEMSPQELKGFIKANPYLAVKIKIALKRLKALQAERQAIMDRFSDKGIDLNQYS